MNLGVGIDDIGDRYSRSQTMYVLGTCHPPAYAKSGVTVDRYAKPVLAVCKGMWHRTNLFIKGSPSSTIHLLRDYRVQRVAV